MRQQRK